MSKVVLVTGGSSGIGLQTALALHRAGCTVYEMSRKASEHAGIIHLTGDVTEEGSIRKAVKTVLEREGHIDILVNNAGFGISGAIEFTEPEAARRQVDVNFFGTVRMCHAVLPSMRKAGAGRIVNLSSVAAPVAIPFQAYYSVSKAAVNTYTQALAIELRGSGITVCAVMPGDIRTGFTAAREKQALGDEVYGGRISRSVAKMERDEENGMDPAKAGAYIARIALKKSVKPLYAIRADYKLLSVLARMLPVRLLNWAVYRLYGR